MSTDFPALQSEPKICSQAVLGAPLMCSDNSVKGDERLDVVSTTNPPGASTNVPGSSNQDTGYEASSSPRKVAKKKGFRSFFRNPWKAIKSFRKKNKVGPCPNPADPKLVPAPLNPKAASESHVANPGPHSGPSNLKATNESHVANPGPHSGPSNIKATDEPHLANPGPHSGPSNIKATDEPHLANPGPHSGPSNIKATDEPHLANPGPRSGPSNLREANESHPAIPGLLSRIFAFVWEKWNALISIFFGKKDLFALYEVGEMISAGASGIVYEGTRKSDGQKVAIKSVRCTSLCDDDIEPEVSVNLLLKKSPLCPNIVQMFDWFQEPDMYLMVMEYPCPCVTLERFISCNGGRLSEPVARGIMLQLIEALIYCFKRGIVHYDLHFCNVLVNTDTLQVKLIDFGLAEVLETTACDPSSRFMFKSPPEQRFKDFYDARCTIVSILGGALLLMMNGYSDGLKPNFSKEVDDLINWCKKKSKEDRPTLEEMLQHDWFIKEELTYDQKN